MGAIAEPKHALQVLCIGLFSMSLFDFFLQEFGGADHDDETSTTTADTRRTAETEAVTEAETADASSVPASVATSNRSGVLVEREDVTAPPPVSTPHVDVMEDLSDIASNELNSVSPTEDMSSAGIGDDAAAAARTTSDATTISSVSMDDLSSLASMAPDAEVPGHSSTEGTGAVIIESVPSENEADHDQQGRGRRWNRLRLPNLRPHSEDSDQNGQTILSSTPSEADDEGVDAPGSSSAPSLSFNPSDIDSGVDTPSSLDSFSAISSMRSETCGEEEEADAVSESNLPKSPHSDPWPAEPTGHDRDVFSAVGNSLLLPSRDASSATQHEHETKDVEWWKYLSEKDWERLQSEARSILDSMERNEEDGIASLPLPPPQPPTDILNSFAEPPSLSHDARSSIVANLPNEFICPICDDVIVGAVVVGCGCPRSTCCFWCIEGGGSKPSAEPFPPEIEEIDEEEEEDYVMVEKSPETTQFKYENTKLQELPVKPSRTIRTTPCVKATCTSCGKVDALVVPCHALDVAICNSISNLSNSSSENETDIQVFLYYYYRRLEEWRLELLSRRNVLEEERNHRRQKMLALLIEAEEAALWSDRSKERWKQRQRFGFWGRHGDRQCTREKNGFGEIAFLAGAIAIATIIGVKLIRRC